MKPETKVWLKCESIGRPSDTLITLCTVREAIKVQANWLLGVYMGSKIRVLIARTEAELSDDRRSAANQDVMQDLESILNGGDFASAAGIDREPEESDGRS